MYFKVLYQSFAITVERKEMSQYSVRRNASFSAFFTKKYNDAQICKAMVKGNFLLENLGIKQKVNNDLSFTNVYSLIFLCEGAFKDAILLAQNFDISFSSKQIAKNLFVVF